MYRSPHECPICHEKLTITQLTCRHCGTRMEGSFEGCSFCSLSPEETMFLITFIKNRGSIKDVERELGVSYPTVRAALDNLIRSLGLDGTDASADRPATRQASTSADSAGDSGHTDSPSGSDTTAPGTDRPAADDPAASGKASGARNTNDPDRAKARKDILNLLAQHRITADEAAKRLKKI